MVLEDPSSGFVGEVMKVGKVALTTGRWSSRTGGCGIGNSRSGVAFGSKASRSTSCRPCRKARPEKEDHASGSFHVEHEARVAKASRIWVEGKHDAELISKIWGADSPTRAS